MKRLKIVFNAPVILGFAGISFLALLLNKLSGGAINRILFSTYRSSMRSPLTYLRFILHVLGHSGWEHFIGNITYLLLLGPSLEEKYGSKRILFIIGITAMITAVINFVFFPGAILCGASGIVFSFVMLISFTGFKDGEVPLTFILVALIFIGQEIYQGFFVHDNISHISHIIGGVIGAGAGYYMNRKQMIEPG